MKTEITHILRRLRASCHPLSRHEKGSVLIELALILPLTLLLALGGFEMYRFLLIQQKITQTTMSMANLISQNQFLTGNIIQDTFNAVDHIMQPYNVGENGKVIITSVVGSGSGAIIDYQCSPSSAFNANSKIGVAGGPANLGSLGPNFGLNDGETTIIAELYYDYKPFLSHGENIMGSAYFSETQLYKIAAYKPRYGSLPLTDNCNGA